MKRTVYQTEDDSLSRMCKAIGRGIQLESKEAKEQANRWAQSWHDKYLKLSWVYRIGARTPNHEKP